ncbi:MAG: adenosylcobalamin-dependent ribonucleoside-diphosphate reductase [Candidatus Heimdallarchaeota archaeon]
MTEVTSNSIEAIPLSENALKVMEKRYLARDKEGRIIETPEEMFRRVARNIAEVEFRYDAGEEEVTQVEDAFYAIMTSLRFLPNSPALMNAGRDLQQLSACFVLPVEDDMASIFEAVKAAALIHQSAGGTGYSFSRLRPEGDVVKSTGGTASGPISFMKVFNASTEIIKQGGCISANSWILTDKGIDCLGALLNCSPLSFNPVNRQVIGPNGPVIVREAQDNGCSHALRIANEHGHELIATYNHQVRVADTDGSIAWKEAEKIQPGDWVVMKRGGYIDQPAPFLQPLTEAPHFNANPINFPTELTEDLAEIIGLYFADGCWSSLNRKEFGRLLFSISPDDPDMVTRVRQRLASLFGLRTYVHKKDGDRSYSIIGRSIELGKWWRDNGLAKVSSNRARIPEKILSSPKKVIYAFLRGLFEGDGGFHKGYGIRFFTVSESFARDIHNLLLAIGIISRLSVTKKRQGYSSNPMWTIFICHKPSLDLYKTKIGFISLRKRKLLLQLDNPDLGIKNEPIPFFGGLLKKYYSLPGRGSGKGRSKRSPHPKLNREISRYMRGERTPSRRKAVSILKTLELTEPLKSPLLREDFVFSKVISTEKTKAHTMDIEVLDGKPEFVANGFIVHNRRRGANMGTLRVDHPDILKFIDCKKKEGELSNFNISVALTDAFMDAVRENQEYSLINPRNGEETKQLSARTVFDLIVERAWQNGEPGVIFIDTINQANPTPAIGEIESTNPCGEVPLLPHSSCNLGSLNLAKHIRFIPNESPTIDFSELAKTIAIAVRFLDNMIDANHYPLLEIRQMSLANRMIGLGVMGFADLLYQLDIPYNSDQAISLAEELMIFIQTEARKTSALLAEERGPFPNFNGSTLDHAGLPPMRNATVTTIAPTGSISILANCSSGIEPVFALSFTKNVLDGEQLVEVNPIFRQKAMERGLLTGNPVSDHQVLQAISKNGGRLQGLPEIPENLQRAFVTATEIEAPWHVKMQAAFQKHGVDNAVSKTINFPNSATREDITQAFLLAYQLGCKGLTVYRDGSRQFQVLETKESPTQRRGAIGPRPRPEETLGGTIKNKTGCGSIYITINEDDAGLAEVFVRIGKSGGCAASQAEATGRLISLALRSGVVVDHIIDTLQGIRCPSPAWNEGGAILSCSDAVAKTLAKHVGKENGASSESKNINGHNPQCPDCGELLIFKEGCISCPNLTCGYSECS